MEFFCFHRDREGAMPLRVAMVEEHWSYMDRFAATMVARGPTFTDDGTLTGSVHIVDLPDPAAARVFAFEEPGYQAGAYRDVLLRRWRNALGRTMRDFADNSGADQQRYLVLGFTAEPTGVDLAVPVGDELIASGPLLSDDGALAVGVAVLIQAPDADHARAVLPAERFVGVEVHRWRFGGRPSGGSVSAGDPHSPSQPSP